MERVEEKKETNKQTNKKELQGKSRKKRKYKERKKKGPGQKHGLEKLGNCNKKPYLNRQRVIEKKEENREPVLKSVFSHRRDTRGQYWDKLEGLGGAGVGGVPHPPHTHTTKRIIT